jgi:hypothetical protein
MPLARREKALVVSGILGGKGLEPTVRISWRRPANISVKNAEETVNTCHDAFEQQSSRL